jgi:hypothetical protein
MMTPEQQRDWDGWTRYAAADAVSYCYVPSGTVLAVNAELTALRQQRDELLAALKQIVLWYECDLALTAEPIKQAKAAIAKAEGVKNADT